MYGEVSRFRQLGHDPVPSRFVLTRDVSSLSRVALYTFLYHSNLHISPFDRYFSRNRRVQVAPSDPPNALAESRLTVVLEAPEALPTVLSAEHASVRHTLTPVVLW